MRIKSSAFIFISFCLFVHIGSLYAQKVTTITLDKKIYPLSSYDLAFDRSVGAMLDSVKRKAYINSFSAGDYADSISKFRLVAWKTNDENGTYAFIVAPYKCDSVYANISISYIETTNYSNIIVGVGKRKFKAFFHSRNNTISLTDISDRYCNP